MSEIKWKLEEIQYSEIKQNKDNPKIKDEDGMNRLKKSLNRFGVVFDGIVNKDYALIDGHSRADLLSEKKDSGMFFVPSRQLTESEYKEMNAIYDYAKAGDIDFDVINEVLDEEQLEFWDIGEYDNNEIELPKKEKERIDSVFKQKIKKGDLIRFEKNNQIIGELFCEDLTNDVFLKYLMSKYEYGFCFADPPYDLEFTFSVSKINGHTFYMSSEKKIIDMVNVNMDYFSRFFSVDFRQAHLISNNTPLIRVDIIAEFRNGANKFINLKDAFSTLIECAKIHKDNEYKHNQIKKIELPYAFISHYTDENDIVLDLFSGAGTTAMAAYQLNRRFVSVECSEEHCVTIIDRLLQYDNSISVTIEEQPHE